MTSTGSNKEYNRIKGLPRQSVRNFVCAGAIPNIFIISYYFLACSKLNVIFHILFYSFKADHLSVGCCYNTLNDHIYHSQPPEK